MAMIESGVARDGQSRRNRERAKGPLETIYPEIASSPGGTTFPRRKSLSLEEGLKKNIGAALDAGTRYDKEKGWA